MGRPTIEDVARIAGVSIATVSRCLHKPEVVAEATRNRILTAVRDTGYALNTAAQSLRVRRSYNVLVVVPDIGNTFFSVILRGIQQVASEAGITMLIGDTGRSPEREEGYMRNLLNGRADGVLLLAEPQAPWLDLPIANSEGVLPVVAISEVLPGGEALSVGIDNVGAARDAVAYLLGLGHKRIAHLAGPETNILTAARRDGYRRALNEAGIRNDPALELAGDFGVASGAAAFERYRTLEPRPTAIFCANDESAMGFISAAHAAGLQVPRDISVVGFDDIHFAQAFLPPLTTVRQPRTEMGAEAMRMLLAIWAQGQPKSVVLPTQMILRDSVAPA
ncbi:MAG: LacI family transcriptional regulator [Cereibacter sphaeroides]|uniref:LacI family transcriptional regulator n=1 Tax=Cereibacter sphaeroides TaxID=1063 RepID=A0A2W5U1G4_CERSP|nr:MAG: LacI family transcriptional regulator [Cereibacter sphaeroides]